MDSCRAIAYSAPSASRRSQAASTSECSAIDTRAVLGKTAFFTRITGDQAVQLGLQMRIGIARLHQTLKVTMIYITHDQTEAMTLADRIVVLRAGLVEQVGRPTDLYDDPVNAFVAGFIGSPRMNFLPATATSATTLDVAGLTLTLPPLKTALRPGQNSPSASAPNIWRAARGGAPSFAAKAKAPTSRRAPC